MLDMNIPVNDPLGESWSPRFCILDVGEFLFDEVGANGRGREPVALSSNQAAQSNDQFTSSGRIPLEMASSVRTARRYHNAFVLVLVDGTEHTFRASDKTW
jgi:hypothetical protein